MCASFSPDLLYGRWVHSHEESKGDRIVFRTPDFDFPPSRGRSAITLMQNDETMVEYPGPTDRTVRATGSWKLEDNALTLTGPFWAGRYLVETVNKELLIVNKQEV